MKAIMGITTSPTSQSNATPFGGQYHRDTSWGMWYFSLNTSIKAGLSTKYLNLPISNKQKRENTKNNNWVMRNERLRRLSEEIRKNSKKLELTWTKLKGDIWNPWKGSWNFLKKWDRWFKNLCEFECLSALEILNNCEVKKRQLSYKALYMGQETSGIYPAQTLKENIVRWIRTSPLDAKDTVSPEAINDTSQIPNGQK